MNDSRQRRDEPPGLVAAEREGSLDLQIDVGLLVAHAP